MAGIAKIGTRYVRIVLGPRLATSDVTCNAGYRDMTVVSRGRRLECGGGMAGTTNVVSRHVIRRFTFCYDTVVTPNAILATNHLIVIDENHRFPISTGPMARHAVVCGRNMCIVLPTPW